MSDRSESEDPQFETDSVDDLAELLGRAANWAERDCGADVIAAELRDGQAFVEDEIAAEPELVTDGGLRGPPGRRGSGSPEWEIEGGEGLPIAHDYRSRLKKDAQIWLFTCCGCGKRMVDPPGPPAGDHTCGGEWICHRFEPKEYSAIRRFNDPRRADEL